MSEKEGVFCLRTDHGMTAEQVAEYQLRWGKGPHFAADLAVFSVDWDKAYPELKLLLVERGNLPFKGFYATPGGFVEFGEDLEDAARRELQEETGMSRLDSAYVEQLGAYGRPGRDPRTRVIGVVFLAVVPWENLQEPCAGDDAAQAKFFSVRGSTAYSESGQALPMAFDHDLVVAHAKKRLRELSQYSNVALRLLPKSFNKSQLEQAYELLLDRTPDTSKLLAWLSRQGWISRLPNEGEACYEVKKVEESWGEPW